MSISCPQCGHTVPEKDILGDAGIARCRKCYAVFALEETQALPRADSSPLPGMPPQIQISQEGADLVIRYRWFSKKVIFLAMFCLVWDSFLVLFYWNLRQSASLLVWLFPLLHVMVGIGLTYLALASFINTTVIRVSFGQIRVDHGPLPWFGRLRIESRQLEQLFCRAKEYRSQGSVSLSYRVSFLLRGKEKPADLLTGLETPEQALQIERRIEEFLGIRDRPVPGEIEQARC